ncbi:toll-like receptor 13 [Platysternon megacephalum]|uniref:Toll-like receptor 13 n=1 Tax=Platysternon megacephalum TaxID=55544 RepID=A0A4D9DNF2_9SAUR|nr:toll-like receptor 13 [Platysternon megacephalum]
MAHANPRRQGLQQAGDVKGYGTVKAAILGTGKATILEEQLMPLTPTLSSEAYSSLGVGDGKG